MKRDQRLRELSSDHHHALVLALRATQAADGKRGDPAEAWRGVLAAFAQDLAPHFDVEERVLLPALERAGESDLARRTREEHGALRAALAADPADAVSALRRFASLLEQHVRFEERELFETAQQRLAPEDLEAVAAATAEHS